ncbi:putative ankyrin 2,3/unc44 [Colletotrichum navitas]|uniref:Ankyrin 2,3/unc44 n=1 Tax=Colletotrichum navitas TaxID=681940 RepID=A0AAD8VA94_9PEZI|nr:putative ankyrin 2,3/unc44 [Colletotrichum navitas]KAK1598849.1 putative ankyrin 2,3/unc44 [Colletotrichum navitas]
MAANRVSLALAAHFGLDDILQSLVEKTQDGIEARGQALIEAARNGQKSSLQILITSKGHGLDVNDTYVQAAMQAACSCGHDELFKILLDAIPPSTQQTFTESRKEETFGEVLHEKNPTFEEDLVVDTSHKPLRWLAAPLNRASYLGLDNITAKLLIDAGENLTAAMDRKGFTPLHLVRTGGAEIVQLLLDKGSSITTPDRFGFTPLLLMSAWGCAAAIETLLHHKSLAEHLPETPPTLWKRTPLRIAASREDPGIVEFLVSKGANLEAVDKDGWSAIFASSLFGRAESVRIFARAGVDVKSYFGENTETPLHVAIKFPETVRVLLQHGANVNQPSSDDDELCTPFDRAVRDNQVETVKIMLEEAKKAPDLTLPSTKKALLDAVAWGYEGVVALVLEAGADVNLVDESGWSLTVRLLVHAGAELTATNKSSWTPIINVLRIGHEEVARYLLTKSSVLAILKTPPGCDVNSQCGAFFATPLMAAASRNKAVQDTERMKTMQYLLDRGADPTIPAGHVAYAISFAAWECSPDIVQFILDRKASTNVSDGFGRKPIHLACYNSLAVLNLLEVQDGDFTVKDSTGRLPLYYAVLSGQMALVNEVLLRSERVGIDINVVDKNDWTPLMWATRASCLNDRTQHEIAQDEDVISLLLEKGANKKLLANGLNRKWSALDIAQYHHAER